MALGKHTSIGPLERVSHVRAPRPRAVVRTERVLGVLLWLLLLLTLLGVGWR